MTSTFDNLQCVDVIIVVVVFAVVIVVVRFLLHCSSVDSREARCSRHVI